MIKKILIIIAIILALLSALFAGRRAYSLFIVGYVLIPVFICFIEKGRKIILYIIPITLFVIILFMIATNKRTINYLEGTFVVLSERIDIDTRSKVEEDFFRDMDSSVDWIWGRGMDGTYKSPQVAITDRLNRETVETGYLNIILHGGFLMLIPYVCLLLYAFFQGLLKSKNIFVKSCALIVLMHFFMLYPDGSPKFTFEYFLLFVIMRICVSEKWRRMSEKEIEISIFK